MPKRSPNKKQALAKLGPIEPVIRVIRRQRVILDSELARIYGVTTARLNQQVNRNLKKFPVDFMFRLNKDEFDRLMLQIATSKKGAVEGESFLMLSPNTARLWLQMCSTVSARWR